MIAFPRCLPGGRDCAGMERLGRMKEGLPRRFMPEGFHGALIWEATVRHDVEGLQDPHHRFGLRAVGMVAETRETKGERSPISPIASPSLGQPPDITEQPVIYSLD